MAFTIRYTIEDVQGLDLIVDFTFHRESDGSIVFDGAWTIFETVEYDGDYAIHMGGGDDNLVQLWLSKGGEDKLYSYVNRIKV